MTILSLFIFIFMMVMAGLGIDSMHHEMRRAHLQATLDAAVLAGAAATSEDEAKAVVQDYFAKNGMSGYLNAIGEDDIEMTLNSAKVTASADMEVKTYLMHLSGVETLGATADATAQIRIPKLEIALVLDVSNSMNDNGKIENLREGAREFVTTIMNSVDPGHAVISIIPFSTSVAPSEEIYEALSVQETHRYSNCLVFEDDDYNDTALVTDTAANNDITLEPIRQAIYTSRYGSFDALNQPWRSCYTEEGYRIMPFSASESELHTKIDSIIADGNTTGSLGVKWGAALLDPSFRDVTAALISSGHMDASLSTVPVDYTEADTQKVIVMMGDGKNTTTYFFDENSDYRGPDSDLFHMEYEQEQFDYAYYIYNSNYRWYGSHNEWRCSQWYAECEYSSVSHSSYFLRDPDSNWGAGQSTDPDTSISNPCVEDANGDLPNGCDDVNRGELDDYWYYDIDDGTWMNGSEFVSFPDSLDEDDEFISRERLSWEEAWGLMPPQTYSSITGVNAAKDEYNNNANINGSTKDTRMDNLCSSAKAQGVVIYTIGFEVAEGGTADAALSSCATTKGPHYYRVYGQEIMTAFGSIAGNVQALRLTQ